MRTMWMGCVILAVTSVVGRADVWDRGTSNDGTTFTRNELIHGSDQWHDLAGQGSPSVADVDYFAMGQSAYASYEIVVDSTGAGLHPGLLLERTDPDGATIQTAAPVSGLAWSYSLRWESTVNETSEFIRVSGAACGGTCTSDDVYRIRAYETTYAIARFNNTGSQYTIVLIQNTRPYAVTGTLWFWNGTGQLLTSQPLQTSARGMFVLNTASLPGAAGQGGSITITHNGGYGALSGKAISIESTAIYETAMVPLIR